MRKIGEMRIWWLWRKFVVEMARILQETLKTPRHYGRGRTSSRGRLIGDVTGDAMASTSRRPAPGGNEFALLIATTRRSGGALATSYIAGVSARLQRNI